MSLIDFDNRAVLGQEVPEHTQAALENYFVHGYEPGSFVTAVLTNDLLGACTRCDHVNRHMLIGIVKWVSLNAPAGSWGSREAYRAWLNNVNNRRTDFKEAVEKVYMWKQLQTT